MEYLLFLLLGGVISVLSGFFGVGGGFILTPVLLLIGFAPLEAIATSLFFSIGTSLSGIGAHFRLKNILWKEGALLGVSGMLATQAAKPLVLLLSAKGLDATVIPACYIILLSYFAFTMFRQGKKSNEHSHEGRPSLARMLLIGFSGGFVSAALGVGGGFIMVPLSIAFLGLQPRKAVGTSLFAVLLIVSTGFLSYASAVEISYLTAILLVAGGLVGSQAGAWLTNFYKNKDISLLLSGLYIATLLSVVFKLIHHNLIGIVLLSLFIAYFFFLSLSKVIRKKEAEA
ncbi:sulfite exporter TauE/SafE family protein [Bacillus infantis]|uniref:sulfite exporter TauE/SafE family protein n=1 Tax=Bacillus infantis TaxID=324767 RepID=UPI002155630A|nr:sulfite exporter TauE/SafE family protein [Bacillus infantis]MCR6608936.1 sulfite exporter TauE/SafE family protein [Bacillus infantis]